MSSTALSISVGETRVLKFTINAGDAAATPLNLTGMDVELKVRPAAGGAAVITKNIGNGGTTFLSQTTSPGQGTILLAASDSSGLTAGQYVYSLWLIDGANKYPLQDLSPLQIVVA